MDWSGHKAKAGRHQLRIHCLNPYKWQKVKQSVRMRMKRVAGGDGRVLKNSKYWFGNWIDDVFIDTPSDVDQWINLVGKENSVFGDTEYGVPSVIAQASGWNMSLETLGINQHEVIGEAFRPEKVCREGESCRRWDLRIELFWRPTSKEEQRSYPEGKGR